MKPISSSFPRRRGRVIASAAALVAVLLAVVWWLQSPVRSPARDRRPVATGGVEVATGAPRSGTRLGGRVVADPGGAPVPGAVVAIVAGGAGSATTTVRADGEGLFSADLAAGWHSLRAAAAGHAQRMPLVVEVSGSTVEVVLHMTVAADGLAGTVVDIESGPVAGAEIRARPLALLGGAAAIAVTDQEGHYALALDDGSYEVIAHHDSYVEERRLISVRGGVRRADFRLFAAGAIEGVALRGRDRAPVEGACVRLEVAESSAGLLPESPQACAMTGVDGRFEIGGVAPGQVALSASAPGLGTWTAHQLRIGIGETVTGVELLLDEAHELRGEVRSSRDDAPLAGIAVVALRSDDQGRLASRALSGADGSFTLVGLTQGTYIVRTEPGPAALKSAVESVAVPIPAPVVLRVAPGATVSGRVIPAAPGRVVLRARSGDVGFDQLGTAMATETIASAEIGADGAFALGGVPSGTWEVHADTSDGTGVETVAVAEQDLANVTIRLGQRASLCGWVRDSAGGVVNDVTVTTLLRNSERVSLLSTAFRQARHALGTEQVPVGEDGGFCLPNLEPGEHFVVARSASSALEWGPRHLDGGVVQPVTLAAGERRADWVLEVIRPSAGVTGTVVDTEGRPVADALVQIVDKVDPNGAKGAAWPSLNAFAPPPPVITDEAGRFRFDRLAQGRYSLVAEHPVTGRSASVDDVATDSPVVITLAATGALQGRLDAKGTGSCRIRLRGPSSKSVAAAGEDCAFDIAGLRAGSYTIEVQRGEGVGYATAEVVAGQPTTVVVSLTSQASVQARFVDGGGQPVPGIVFLLVSNPAAMESLALELLSGTLPRSDADGRVTAVATTGQALATAITADGRRVLYKQPVGVPLAGLDLGDVVVTP